MAKFKTVVRKARFAAPGYRPEQMIAIAQATADDIRVRIMRAQDVNDGIAPGLKAAYAKRKSQRGGNPIRDWFLTGRTLRSLKVLSAAQNRAVIGFTDAVSNFRAALNNRRWRQFGISPTNRQALVRELKLQASPVKVVKVA